MTYRIFMALIGVKPFILTILWQKYKLSALLQPRHFLWTLNFLKEYSTTDSLSSKWNVSAKTYATAVFRTLHLLAENLNEVDFQDRLEGIPLFTWGLYSGALDATECPIERPKNWRIRRLLYSGKQKTFTVKYESK